MVGFTIDGPCQIAVADMAMAVMPIQARQQQRCVPGHTPGQPQENDASWPAQVGECKGQRRICCRGRQNGHQLRALLLLATQRSCHGLCLTAAAADSGYKGNRRGIDYRLS